MTHPVETLTELVAERVGDGRELTYRAFEDRAVDPQEGKRPSRDTLWKISHGKDVKINPALVRAIAAGLNLPEARVQAAAAYQFTGLVTTDIGGGQVMHTLGSDPDTARARAAVDGLHVSDEEEVG